MTTAFSTTSAITIPSGEARGTAKITADGLVVSCDTPVWGKADIGAVIYASKELRTITAILSPYRVRIAIEFGATVVNEALIVIVPRPVWVRASGNLNWFLSTADGPESEIDKTFEVSGEFSCVLIRTVGLVSGLQKNVG